MATSTPMSTTAMINPFLESSESPNTSRLIDEASHSNDRLSTLAQGSSASNPFWVSPVHTESQANILKNMSAGDACNITSASVGGSTSPKTVESVPSALPKDMHPTPQSIGMLAPFYHGSFEFYGPYNRGLLVDHVGYPLLSMDEWRDLLALVNSTTLTENVPQKLKQFRQLACLSFSLLLCGIGVFLLIPLWISAKSYERAFVGYAQRVSMFLDACTEGFSTKGLLFRLVRASDPCLAADLEHDPYDLCISVSRLKMP